MQNLNVDRQRLARLVRRQDGVVSLADLASVGVSKATTSRRVRDSEWQRLVPGVFLASHGQPTFEQKIVAASKWSINHRAVFHLDTAAFLHRLIKSPPRTVQLLVPFNSSLRTRSPYVQVTRTRLPIRSFSNPPRTSLVQTVADMIQAAPTEAKALEIMISAIRRRLRIDQFKAEVARRHFLRHRSFVGQLLELPREGIESHLELRYVKDVELAHGLPRSVRQRDEMIRGLWIRSDRWYRDFKVRCELDGELAHPGRASDADVMRDNDVRGLLDETTLRYRWPQVTNMPCTVAAQVAQVLHDRGWAQAPQRCSPECPIDVDLALGR